MTRELPDTFAVELDAAELGERCVVGTLRHNRATGGSIVGFSYASSWVTRPDAFTLDPLHGLYAGDQWPRDGHIDGIFTDSAPDRWGRTPPNGFVQRSRATLE